MQVSVDAETGVSKYGDFNERLPHEHIDASVTRLTSLSRGT